MVIRPYRALRPRADLAHLVSALPYDVVSRAEAGVLGRDNPYSLFHISRAEIDLDPSVGPYEDAVYAQAARAFARFREEGLLEQAPQPGLYLYEQTMGCHRQRGLAALGRVEDYDRGLIKRHEKTRQDKEDDRTRLTRELRCNLGPVFLLYRDRPVIDQLVDQVAARPPGCDFVAPDGIRHRVWEIPDSQALVRAFAEVPHCYIADGHHRAASAARVGRELARANPGHTGEEDYAAFSTVLFPASQLRILPYHRLVRDLAGHSPAEFLDRLGRAGLDLAPASSGESSAAGEVRLFADQHWWSLRFPPTAGLSPIARLDVSRLQDGVFAPLLGIDDPRTSPRLEFVGGVRGPGYLEEAVLTGRAAAAFALFPVTVEQLMEIADAGEIMPPKSTWFEPKLRSGLFMHTF